MIDLTTDYDPGSQDPGQTYGYVMVTQYTHIVENSEIILECKHGHNISGVFNAGTATPIKRFVIRDHPDDLDANGVVIPDTADPQYTTLMDILCPNTTDKISAALDKELHQWLLDKNKFAGTIV